MPGNSVTEILDALMKHPILGGLFAFLGAVIAALLGRMLYVAEQVRIGNRRFWTWSLLLELPIALGMGLIMAGFAEWLDLSGTTAYALVAAGAYLGPHGLESLLHEIIRHRRGRKQ